MIQERHISFKVAELAKEKGFSWGYGETQALVNNTNNSCYNEEGKIISPKFYNNKNKHYPRPTQNLLSKWLRDVFKINVHVYIPTILQIKRYTWTIVVIRPVGRLGTDEFYFEADNQFENYEDALEEALYWVLVKLDVKEGKIIPSSPIKQLR